MEKIPFSYSIHPGDILKSEFMEPFGLLRLSFSKGSAHSRASGKRFGTRKAGAHGGYSDATRAYFGTSPQFWLGLQMDYDLWLASKNRALAKVKPRARAA
jgi:addiction module HigA family antidote